MKTIQLPGVDFPVSQVCLGTAYMGSREDEATSFAILDEYFEQGGRFLNTAHEYGLGASERTVGKWIRERGVRDQIILTSKCGEDATKPRAVAMHAEELFEDIDETLQRTGLEQMDFYLLHLDDPEVPVGEIVDAMYEIRRQGKIRYYGCSNWSCERQQEAADWADAHGYPRFAVDEIEMNLCRLNWVSREFHLKWMDEEAIADHQRTGMPAAAYSPIASAVLSKYLRDGDTRAWLEWQVRNYANDDNFAMARRLQKLEEETGFTTVQLQLAFVLAQPYGFPTFPILGASKVSQLKESLKALECPMTDDMIRYLLKKEG